MKEKRIKSLLRKIDKNFNKYKDSIEKKENIEKEELNRLLNKLKNDKMSKKDIAHIISLFGSNIFKEAKREIERYIDDKDEIIRYNVLTTLILDFGLREHYKTARRLLLNDPDAEVRGLSATCIGSLKRETKDKEALSILLNTLKNKKEHWLVRSSAYSAILDILGIPRRQQPGALGDDFEDYIDWNLIKTVEKHIKKTK